MREVLAEIGADKVPELIVINKADAADPMVHQPGCGPRAAPRRGQRQDRRGHRRRARGRSRPSCRARRSSSTALLPYERGDLVNRIHQQGEIDSIEHTGDGTLVVGRANADLAGELAAYGR